MVLRVAQHFSLLCLCDCVCQRDAGVQRLSRYFSWPEFSDERRCFHQEFVYDVVVFAADCGFSWPNVIRAAVIARDIFPRSGRLYSCLQPQSCLAALSSSAFGQPSAEKM
uniref:Secreted protein n=1 Tax=Haplochromis burtoni TaxID=8153 RepID=A0A3Q2VNU4_HAPBU